MQLVTACSSAPPAKPANQLDVSSPNRKPAAISYTTSTEYLTMARTHQDSPSYLLKAAQAARDEQNLTKSLVITQTSDLSNFPLAIQQQMLLIEIANLLDLNDLNSAEQRLHSELAKTPAIHLPIMALKSQLFTRQQRYIESLQQLFILEKAAQEGIYNQDVTTISKKIWTQLNLLPNITLNAFDYPHHTNAQSWLELVMLIRLYAGQPKQLQQHLQHWHQSKPFHTAMTILPDSFQRALNVTPFSAKKIAVILPFTGALRAQAQTIRNGLILANQHHHQAELIFIDSQLPITTIEQRLTASQAEFVIGPLRKNKVALFSQNPLIRGLPTLFLNRIDIEEPSIEQHFYFGLTPEDEVEQAAKTLFQQGYQKPSIIAPDNRLGERLSDKFTQVWLQQPSSYPQLTPEIIFYKNQQQMQKAVDDLMDVKQSKGRIKQLKRLVNKELKTETRNRRDLDLIYIIGNPTQTALLKPLIEVNNSPFAQSVAVYATSSSHNIDKSLNSKRELRSLTFTEMPWMLDFNKRYQPQRNIFNQLWPEHDGSLRRLFALGYDALYLIDSLAQLRVLNGLSEQGMSGELTVDTQGSISRIHQWVKYNEKGQVISVDLD